MRAFLNRACLAFALCIQLLHPQTLAAQEVIENLRMDPIFAPGMEYRTLSADLVDAALAQAAPVPKSGFTAIGVPVLVGKNFPGRFHARASGWGGCFPDDGDKCIEAPQRAYVARAEGASGWCNPPFVNLAIQSSVDYGDGQKALSLAHSEEDKQTWRISLTPDTMMLFYRAFTMAQSCEGGYVAVVDEFWEGFGLPLKRYVLHLGNQSGGQMPYPDCYNDGKWSRACNEVILNPFGGEELPQTFAEVQALFDRPPPPRLAPAPALERADVAGADEGFLPWYEDLDPSEGRRGFAHHGWNGTRIELGCATGEFGSMKGHVYGMVSAPVAQFKNHGKMAAFAAPNTLGGKIRVSLKVSKTSGASSPFVPAAASGGFDHADGRRFGFVVDLSSPQMRRYIDGMLSEGAPVISFFLGLFPEDGDAIFSYAIKDEEASERDIRGELMNLLRTCQ